MRGTIRIPGARACAAVRRRTDGRRMTGNSGNAGGAVRRALAAKAAREGGTEESGDSLEVVEAVGREVGLAVARTPWRCRWRRDGPPAKRRWMPSGSTQMPSVPEAGALTVSCLQFSCGPATVAKCPGIHG